jgi:hypothetical protein
VGDRATLPTASIILAANVALWIFLGGEPATAAHKAVKSKVLESKGWLWAVLVVPVVLIASLIPVLLQLQPSRKFTEFFLEEAKNKEPGASEFFPPCITLEPVAASSSEVTGRLLNQFSNGCNGEFPGALLSQEHPLLFLGEPAAGKSHLLERLRGVLATREKPVASVFIHVRDCERTLDGISLSGCVQKTIDRVAKSIYKDSPPPDAIREFEASEDWWLFVDGIDDVGDERLVIPMLRELARLRQLRGNHLLVSGRADYLAYLVYRQGIDEEVRRIFTTFVRVGVKGLSEEGSIEMIDHLTKTFQDGDRTQTLLDGIRKMGLCSGPPGLIAHEIVTLPGLLLALPQYRGHIRAGAECSSSAWYDLTSWMLERRFEAYCRPWVCGTENQENYLRAKWLASIKWMRAQNRKTPVIKRQALVEEIADPTTSEDVVRALIETGPLTVVGNDEFRIEEQWLASP